MIARIKRTRFYAKYVRLRKTNSEQFQNTLTEEADCYCAFDSADKKKVKKDMKKAYVNYRFSPSEYVDFRLYGKKAHEIREYYSLEELREVFIRGKLNTLKKNKYEKYCLLSDFFHRDVIRIDGTADSGRYLEFCKKHGSFVSKPIKGTKGHGVRLVSSSEADSVEKLARIVELPVILEQLIRQGEELRAFHPSSVNTVRVVSFLDQEGAFTVLFALFRCGQGGSLVDNVGSGGLISMIDTKTGRIVSDALFHHKLYQRHPDTGLEFKNTTMPQWEQLMQIVEKAHRSVPQQRVIGWDFAWSQNGWDMVELNPAPSFASYQTLTGKGIRPKLQEIGLF